MVFEEEFNNKNQLNKILKKVDTIQGKAIIDLKNKTINAKFSATMTGDYMANNGFTQKQLEQLGLLIKPIWEEIKKINERLDVIEEDIKAIKECPTIQKEIKKD